jgi:hypothetical protein
MKETAKQKAIRRIIKEEINLWYSEIADFVEISCKTCCFYPSKGACISSVRGSPCELWEPTCKAFCDAFNKMKIQKEGEKVHE